MVALRFDGPRKQRTYVRRQSIAPILMVGIFPLDFWITSTQLQFGLATGKVVDQPSLAGGECDPAHRTTRRGVLDRGGLYVQNKRIGHIGNSLCDVAGQT
jgi:hypothetical protein